MNPVMLTLLKMFLPLSFVTGQRCSLLEEGPQEVTLLNSRHPRDVPDRSGSPPPPVAFAWLARSTDLRLAVAGPVV